MNPLADIPDPDGMTVEAVHDWLNGRLAAIDAMEVTQEVRASFVPVELAHVPEHPMGPEASPEWRRFCLAILLADWASYRNAYDRSDVPRHKYIMASSYRFFRVWCCRLPDGQMTPVGYSGWYPISQYLYNALLDNSDQINDRGAFLPLRFVEDKDIEYGYAFNISVAKPLRNTSCSHRIIRAYQRDAMKWRKVNAISVTVDEAGQRASRMANFQQLGAIEVMGHTEGLFVRESP